MVAEAHVKAEAKAAANKLLTHSPECQKRSKKPKTKTASEIMFPASRTLLFVSILLLYLKVLLFCQKKF